VIDRPIGEGASAIVFEAHHEGLQKRVAIKVLLASQAENTDVAQRFVREGRSTAKLKHPHLIDVIDVGTTTAGIPYLVMEFLEGEDLERHLRRTGRLGVEEAVDLLLPVMSGVAAAHQAGIIHRDLKPQNIFLSRQGRSLVPKVVDFGISKLTQQEGFELTGTKALLGTPFYMSPEQAQAKRGVDARSDVFALGVLLYECVTGKKPFMGDSLYELLNAIVTSEPRPLRELVPDAPAALVAAVQTALRKAPEQRFASVRELGRALLPLASVRTRAIYAAEFEGHAESTARPVQVRLSGPRRRNRVGRLKRSLLPAALAALVLVSAGLWATKPPEAAPVAASAASALVPTAAPGSSGSPPVAARAAPQPTPPAEPHSLKQAARYEVSVSVLPAHAHLVLDGHTVSTSKFIGAFKADGSTHVLDVSAEGYRPASVVFQDAPPPSLIQLEKLLGEPKRKQAVPARTSAKPGARPQWKPDPFADPAHVNPSPPAPRPSFEPY
jgi:tRNA A-37 threonylcarbamoyl transferase component Bud32